MEITNNHTTTLSPEELARVLQKLDHIERGIVRARMLVGEDNPAYICLGLCRVSAAQATEILLERAAKDAMAQASPQSHQPGMPRAGLR